MMKDISGQMLLQGFKTIVLGAAYWWLNFFFFRYTHISNFCVLAVTGLLEIVLNTRESSLCRLYFLLLALSLLLE